MKVAQSALRRVFAGDRRVWLAAAAVGLILGGVCIYYVTRAEYPSYTSTNAVGPSSFSVEVGDGKPLCVPDLTIPKGSGYVRIFTPSPRPRMAMSIEATTGNASATLPAGNGPAQLPLPASLRGDATLCVVPLGAKTGLGGNIDFHGPGEPGAPTRDGRLLDNVRVSVWVLPPASDKSFVSQIGTIFDRAAMMRPAWIGPWLYYLLLFGLIPLLWIVAIRTLALAAAGRASRIAVVVAAIAFANAATWAFVNPIFNAPDEPDHVSYAQTLAEQGDVPDAQGSVSPPNPAYSLEEVVAARALHTYDWVTTADGRPPWDAASERYLDRQLRLDPSRSNGGGENSTSPHSPLYYGLLAPAYAAGSGGSLITRVTLMRLTSALLGGLTAALVVLLMLELFPRVPFAAAAAGLLVAYEPMFNFMSGSVNNDVGVNAVAALLAYLLIRGLRRGLTVRLGIAIGATLVALPLAKGTGLALYPAALVAIAAILWRSHERRDLKALAAIGGAGVVVLGAWAAIAGALGRTISPIPPTGPAGGGVLGDPAGYLSYTWQVFLPKLPFMTDLFGPKWPAFEIYVIGGWANFGWVIAQFPRPVYYVIAAVGLCMLPLGILALRRERAAARSRVPELAVLALIVIGVLASTEAAYFTTAFRPIVAEQGRYIFIAIAALAPFAVGACYAFGRRTAVTIATALVAATMMLSFASFLMFSAHVYS